MQKKLHNTKAEIILHILCYGSSTNDNQGILGDMNEWDIGSVIVKFLLTNYKDGTLIEQC